MFVGMHAAMHGIPDASLQRAVLAFSFGSSMARVGKKLYLPRKLVSPSKPSKSGLRDGLELLKQKCWVQREHWIRSVCSQVWVTWIADLGTAVVLRNNLVVVPSLFELLCQDWPQHCQT